MTIALCAVLGAVAGLLVPRIAYRLSVPAGSPSRSACAKCDTPFSAGPTGWVSAGGRCSGCGVRQGPHRWLTGSVGALTFAALAWAFGPVPALAPMLAGTTIGVLLAFVDLACLRLPDRLVGTALLVGGAPLVVIALVDGEPGRIARAAIAATACLLGYLVVALLPGANLGFGDVKLAGVLGFLLGWLGWPAVVLGLLIPHLINGPIALVLLLTGRAGRGTHLPLGPALLAGALVAAVVGARLPAG